jgi:hypothetical protein
MKLKLMFTQVQKDIRFDGTGGSQTLSRQHSEQDVGQKLSSLNSSDIEKKECVELIVDDSVTPPNLAHDIVGFLESMSEHESNASDNHSTGEIESHESMERGDASRPASSISGSSEADNSQDEQLTEQQLLWRKHNRERIERRKARGGEVKQDSEPNPADVAL